MVILLWFLFCDGQCCDCCFHYLCLLKECYNTARSRAKLNLHGIRCPTQHRDIDNLQNTITGDDINIIIELFQQKLLDNKNNEEEVQNTVLRYGSFYDNYTIISQFLTENLEKNLTREEPSGCGEEKVDLRDEETEKYLELTTKKCPSCPAKTIRYHGHACHHIKPARY